MVLQILVHCLPRWLWALGFFTAYPGTIDQRTLNEETALYLATSRGNLDCLLTLLQAGAEPDISNKARETPLYKGKGGASRDDELFWHHQERAAGAWRISCTLFTSDILPIMPLGWNSAIHSFCTLCPTVLCLLCLTCHAMASLLIHMRDILDVALGA